MGPPPTQRTIHQKQIIENSTRKVAAQYRGIQHHLKICMSASDAIAFCLAKKKIV